MHAGLGSQLGVHEHHEIKSFCPPFGPIGVWSNSNLNFVHRDKKLLQGCKSDHLKYLFPVLQSESSMTYTTDVGQT